MTEDKWLTVEETKKILIEEHCSVVSVLQLFNRLHGYNEFGVSVFSTRIFDGTEHKLAKPGMVLDWRKT
jgi:hypothetical protein